MPPIRFDVAERPRLLVVVDTEEEFDWSAPPDRSAVSVKAMAHLDRVERIFAGYGIVPLYATDWPVAATREGVAPLLELARAGRAEIGAHLHPWVNPPHDEPLSARNTYAGNLPQALERAKLARLTERLAEELGRPPRFYKAGRYGLGPHTPGILHELGYETDLSVCPTLDSSADGGPDYTDHGCEPWLFGEASALEIPLTAAFIGALGNRGRGLYRFATDPSLLRFRLPAILSRARLLDRLVLSPEGFTAVEHRRLTQYLIARGVRVFTWSFHSPSVLPGCTPYVNSEAELGAFLDSFRRYFDWFFGELGGITSTPSALVRDLRARSVPPA